MALTATDFNFPGQKGVYHGKVRDVYNMGDKLVTRIVEAYEKEKSANSPSMDN